MRFPVLLTAGVLINALGAGFPAALHAQVRNLPLPSWDGGELLQRHGPGQRVESAHVSLNPLQGSSATRPHAGTGLLVGGLVGVAATTVFLVGFCSDPDTVCGADEVGRAVLVFLIPPAVVGAIIGSLVRTER